MTEHQSEADLGTFYREASSWADDRQARAARSGRLAWIIAGVATTVAALQAIALAGLVPLKTVVPHTVLVDRQTGHVTTLDPSRSVSIAPDGALAKSMLAQYVTARESVDRSSISLDYRTVMLWSAGPVRQSYAELMKPGNPENPLARYPQQSLVQTAIKSVSLLEGGQALVRYDLMHRSSMGSVSRPIARIAVIRFQFRDRPLAESDRFINPLGFEVTRYRTDPEAVPAVREVSAPVATGAALPQASVIPGSAGNEGVYL